MNNRTQLEYIFRQLSALPKITDMEHAFLSDICAFEELPTRSNVIADADYTSGRFDEETVRILKDSQRTLNLNQYLNNYLSKVENLTPERQVALKVYLTKASEIISDVYEAVSSIATASNYNHAQLDADTLVPMLEEGLNDLDQEIIFDNIANFLQLKNLISKGEDAYITSQLVGTAARLVVSAFEENLAKACTAYKDSLLKRVAEEAYPNEKFLDDQAKIDAGMTRYMDKSKKPTLLCRAIAEVDGYKKIRSDQSDPEVKIKKMQTYIEKMTNNKVITQDKHQDSKNFVSVLKKIGSGLQNAFKIVKRATKKFFDNVKTQTPLLMDDIKNKFRAKS